MGVIHEAQKELPLKNVQGRSFIQMARESNIPVYIRQSLPDMGFIVTKPVFMGFRQSETQTSLLSYSN